MGIFDTCGVHDVCGICDMCGVYESLLNVQNTKCAHGCARTWGYCGETAGRTGVEGGRG